MPAAFKLKFIVLLQYSMRPVNIYMCVCVYMLPEVEKGERASVCTHILFLSVSLLRLQRLTPFNLLLEFYRKQEKEAEEEKIASNEKKKKKKKKQGNLGRECYFPDVTR